MTENRTPGDLAQRFPRWSLQRRLLRARDLDLDAATRCLAIELCERTDVDGEIEPFHVADVMALCEVSERTARRIVERFQALKLATINRAGRRGYRAFWNAEHPTLRRVLELARVRAERAALLAEVKAAAGEGREDRDRKDEGPGPLPLSAEERKDLEVIQRAHLVARSRRFAIPMTTPDTAIASGRARSLVEAFRLEAAAHGVPFELVAEWGMRAYTKHDGGTGQLKARGWPLNLAVHDLGLISIGIAKRAAAHKAAGQGATPPAPAPAPPEPGPRRPYGSVRKAEQQSGLGDVLDAIAGKKGGAS